MSESDKDEAKTLAKRSAKQLKHSSVNAARATRVVAEEVVDDAQEAVEEVADVAKRVNTGVLSRMSSQTGQAFLALSVSIVAATFATNKFRAAYEARKQVVQ